jgi:hypothetical protein
MEGIAASLGPSTVELILPLNAAECLSPQLPSATVARIPRNQVILQDGIQIPCPPLQVALGGYLKAEAPAQGSR